ncbi:G2/M phase-specific E3 ubiquitin-protein ligase-like [Notolabrus celidotus]|uniref:G2/M phase-specific E3 ubiquitin-protein ligase-like n=1 Tax=Notolabrus celidotus TaxID=1203425 RepID=UPI00148F7105|nr:G2/M phase-specific E3 ubiquitin-protein ligase-like [Notolabrus celidotus]
MARIHKPAQEPEELSDSDFESPARQRRKVRTAPLSPRESELHYQDPEDLSDDGSDNGRQEEMSLHQDRMHDPVSSSPMESEARHQETGGSTLESENEGQAEDLGQLFPYNLAEFVPVYLEEDDALEEAIQRSLLEESDMPSSVHVVRSSEMLSREEIAGLLKAHSERVVSAGTRQVHISRANVWITALRPFKRPSFVESHDMLYVKFASDEQDAEEDAADFGGPRREFFRLLVKAIFQDSGAFEGTPNGCAPRLNILHLQQGVYRTIGRMMSTIIVQGGEPPAFLSPHVVDYIVSGDVLQVHVTLDNIGDPGLRENLKKVKHAATQEDLEEAVSCCDSWRFQVEGLPLTVTMSNRDAFVKNAALYHAILQRQSCLDQLTDGLSYYGVLSLLRENPCLRVLLDKPEEGQELGANFIAGVLKPSYSVLGSNRRAKEEMTVVKFREFLQCVENKELQDAFGDRTLTKDEEAFLKALSPGHILAFATGSSKVPAIGFHPTPKVTFIHDESKNFPIAHTCANELQLFVNTKLMADDDEFHNCFLVALMNGSLFSTI